MCTKQPCLDHNKHCENGLNLLSLLFLFRHRKYLEMCYKGKVEPERMPPTERAAFFHGLRVHLQIVAWKMLEDNEVQLNPCNWGWIINGNTMTPIKTDKAVAPESLLKVIRCNCKMSSKAPCATNQCSCRKHGLSCLSSCGECHGEACENEKVKWSFTTHIIKICCIR